MIIVSLAFVAGAGAAHIANKLRNRVAANCCKVTTLSSPPMTVGGEPPVIMDAVLVKPSVVKAVVTKVKATVKTVRNAATAAVRYTVAKTAVGYRATATCIAKCGAFMGQWRVVKAARVVIDPVMEVARSIVGAAAFYAAFVLRQISAWAIIVAQGLDDFGSLVATTVRNAFNRVCLALMFADALLEAGVERMRLFFLAKTPSPLLAPCA